MRRALVLEYDGTAFAGFQVQPQPERRTVQGVLQQALQRLIGTPVKVAGAGRTDAGVHARGQVAAFDAPPELPLRAFVRGLNSLLPDDVAVITAKEVAADFDPRRHARDRWYRYTLLPRTERSPLERMGTLLVSPRLDVAAMASALRRLEGTHDYAAFTTPGADAPDSTVRCIMAARLTEAGGLWLVDVVGTAFLPQQLRRIVGALLLVGNRRRPPEWFGELLNEAQPGAAGPAAQPQGLCLMAVRYPPPHNDLLPPFDGRVLHGVPRPGEPEGDDDHAGNHPEDLFTEGSGPETGLARH